MTDNDFLQWIYNRMVEVHNENELYDYMHKFKGIIEKNKMTEKDKNQMVRLCKNCKYYRKDWISHILGFNYIYDTCACPHTSRNLVTGNENRFCDMLRAERWKELDYSCGPDGRFFEARK